MLPHDLPGHQLSLPPGNRQSAVLFTGSGLRHLRLGYKLQRVFPGLLTKWWCESSVAKNKHPHKGPSSLLSVRFWKKWFKKNIKLQKAVNRSDLEREMFEDEVNGLKNTANIHPEFTNDRNSNEILNEVRSNKPYFLLTLGGPLIKEPLLSSIRGLAINQHAGWSPDLKGSKTIETALYHRRIDQVGSTIHLMTTAADAGPILKRSNTTLHADDTPEHCFLATVALGTELMLETISEALTEQTLTIFDQPASGVTVKKIDFTAEKKRSVKRDFAKGWLKEAIHMETRF